MRSSLTLLGTIPSLRTLSGIYRSRKLNPEIIPRFNIVAPAGIAIDHPNFGAALVEHQENSKTLRRVAGDADPRHYTYESNGKDEVVIVTHREHDIDRILSLIRLRGPFQDFFTA